MTDQERVGQHQTEHDPLIIIASNRGPYSFKLKADGRFATRRGEGGLVTALAALAEHHDVLWISAALTKDDQEWAQRHANEAPVTVGNMRLKMLIPDRHRYRQYYNVISNPLLWFIQHELWDAPRNPVITEETWKAWQEGYVAINRHFADTIADCLGDVQRRVILFPQDYHLYLVPQFLRERLGMSVQIQPFIHIPWPGPDAWRALPGTMRTALLESLLAADRIGFQTSMDAFNFIQTCRMYVPEAHSGGSREYVEYQGRRIMAKPYPISIDVEKVQNIADDQTTRLLKRQLLMTIGDNRLILRTDRIEPSKNILRGLLAYRALLEKHPEHRGKVKLLQLLVPSRMEVDQYQTYLQEVMAAAAMINADFSDDLWEPVRTIIGNNYARAIAAMELYDILVVNPISDGMNLVAKEGVLVNKRHGVLILSELAGAFYELGEHALTIPPYDVYSTAEAMHRALTMRAEERQERADALRDIVKHHDVKDWFRTQVSDGLADLESSQKIDPTPTAVETEVKNDKRRKTEAASSTP